MELKVGKSCFVKGEKFKGYADIVAEQGDCFIIVDGEHMQGTFAVDKNKCEPIAALLFSVGDTVCSAIATGTFVGTVVGFEMDTNRVICRSQAIDNYKDKRTRYAYLPSEILHYSANTTLLENLSTYVLNGSKKVALIKGENNKYLLIDENGEVVVKNLYLCMHNNALIAKGIYSLYKVE